MNSFFLNLPIRITIIERLIDGISLFISFIIGYSICLLLNADVLPPQVIYLRHAAVYSLLGIVVFHIMGIYNKQMSLMNIIEIRKIVKSNFILYLALLSLSYILKHNYSVAVISYSMLIALFVTFIERMLLYKFHQALNIRGIRTRRVIIIGAGEIGRQLYKKIILTPKLGYKVVGFYDEDDGLLDTVRSWGRKKYDNGFAIIRSLDEFNELSAKQKVDEVLIARPSMSSKALGEIIQFLNSLDIKFSYVPYLFGAYVEQLRVKDIGGIPMFSTGRVRISRSEEISKKFFDIIVSSVVMFLAIPLFFLIGYLIKKDSPGPVFFKQTRIGKDGHEFEIIKFRTMYVDTPVYADTPTNGADPRITYIGRFLRKTSLDELPQLINVIKGEMSLVGPRPEMPFIVEQYNSLQRERLRVKPGITGIWQISQERSEPIHNNIYYDLFYIENRSILLDLVIILRTVLFAVLVMRTH